MKAESRKQKAESRKPASPAGNPDGFGIGSVFALRSSAFSSLDLRFADFIQRLAGGDEQVGLGAAIASWQSREANVCADLRRLADTVPDADGAGKGEDRLPKFEPWVAALRKSPVVGAPGEFKPLVLDPVGRLYLHRYWKYEQELAGEVFRRASDEVTGVDWAVFRAGVARLFPNGRPGEVDWQKVACFAAMRRRLCVISGGPGTGKTRTVGVLLALLLEQPGAERLRLALAAPTGKAAARLQESIRALKASLPLSDEVKARLPEEAATLHRLLGLREGTAKARFDAGHPLPYDVVIVDEASMVDLALMAKLFAAVPATSRLVLLGDKDQLASVESGAVLADICGAQPGNSFSAAFAKECAALLGEPLEQTASPGVATLNDCVVQLEKNYRFGSGAGIGEVSRAVNDGDAAGALDRMRDPASEVRWRSLPAVGNLRTALRPVVVERFQPYLAAGTPEEAIRLFSRFRILCAVRHGPFGVEAVNALVEEILGEEGLITRGRPFYAGRPVLVLENDYPARLFNGDLGLARVSPAGDPAPTVYFTGPDGALRQVPPVRLPRHETAFAMTVHKSQGSEFESVLLLLPERDSPCLTRELIYTGLTRAGRTAEVWAPEPLLKTGITRRIVRASGLGEKLRPAGGTGIV